MTDEIGPVSAFRSDERWLRSDQVAVVDSGDRMAMANLRDLTSPPMLLEGSAAVIWRRLDGRPLAEVVSAVAEEFAMTPAQIEADVVAFVTDLAARGLAERVERG